MAAPTSNSERKPKLNTEFHVFDRDQSEGQEQPAPNQTNGWQGNNVSSWDIENKEVPQRLRDKKQRATVEGVWDRRVIRVIAKLENQEWFDDLYGVISTGKEANVYNASATIHPREGEEGEPRIDRRVVKIYKTSILMFRDRERYISGDWRWHGGHKASSNWSKVCTWGEKEFRNLQRIWTVGVPCPEPLVKKGPVLIMTFVDDGAGNPAPKLKDYEPQAGDDEKSDAWLGLYLQCLDILRRLYRECRLVHADFSEYNLLVRDGKVVVIDVSQSVGPEHPRGRDFLRMDIKNITDFFRRKGVDVFSEKETYQFVTSMELQPEASPKDVEFVQFLRERLEAMKDWTEEQTEHYVAEDNVWRGTFIPQTLTEVYNADEEAEKVANGEAGDLVYAELLADLDKLKPQLRQYREAEESDSDEDTSTSSTISTEDSTSFEHREPKTPRGHRHEDRDAKRERKKEVKEAQAEKRKHKIKKHIKKKMVASHTGQATRSPRKARIG